MAISRSQQPRQNYGLGSFVKKAFNKVTKPFTKVAKKVMPKELAGIARMANRINRSSF
jgi:stalled ribosome alternative rescue factor ArfA